jgi:hypothetical protein
MLKILNGAIVYVNVALLHKFFEAAVLKILSEGTVYIGLKRSLPASKYI